MLLDVSDPHLCPRHPARGSAEPSALLPPLAPFWWHCLGWICPETAFLTKHLLQSGLCAGPVSGPSWSVDVSGDGTLTHPGVGGPGKGLHLSMFGAAPLQVTPAQWLYTFSHRSFAPGAADAQQSGLQHFSASSLESSARRQHWLHRHPVGEQISGAGQKRVCGEQLDECHL